MKKDYPDKPPCLQMNDPIQRTIWLMEKYRDYELRMLPAGFITKSSTHLLYRKKGDSSPVVIPLGNVTGIFQNKAVHDARQRLQDGIDRYDYVSLSEDQWTDLLEKEEKLIDALPTPFSYEALQDFCISINTNSVPLVFQKTKLEATTWQGQKLYPLVDCAIGVDRKQRLQAGGIGLLELEGKDLYQIAYYWMLEIPERLIPDVVQTISSYFVVQNAFHICPERIVEVKTDGANLQEDTTPGEKKTKTKSSHPNKSTMHRTIYLRDIEERHTGRKFDYQCECWYVRGFWRKLKSGQKVWIEGYYKGRRRNDETARKHTKDYVL